MRQELSGSECFGVRCPLLNGDYERLRQLARTRRHRRVRRTATSGRTR
jgi:hypothetical protein